MFFRHNIIQVLFIVIPLGLARTTQGPLADVSIAEELAYKTARSCAACCIVYNGVFGANNAGFQDLAVHQQCGAGGINGCYCAYPSLASAYLTSCVQSRCGKSVTPIEPDISSMVGLYDGYCAMVVKAVATTSKSSGAATITGAAAGSSAALSSSASSTSTQKASETTTAPPLEKKTNTVAIGAGVDVGVGVPLLRVLAALIFIVVKRKSKANANAATAPLGAGHVGAWPNDSTQQVLPSKQAIYQRQPQESNVWYWVRTVWYGGSARCSCIETAGAWWTAGRAAPRDGYLVIIWHIWPMVYTFGGD
jgi:hypothetical protein